MSARDPSEEGGLERFGGDPRLGGAEEGRRRRRGLDRAAQQLREPAEVRLQHLEHPRRVEGGRRVEERVEQDARTAERDLLLAAVNSRDPERLAREELRREVAQCGNDLRLDELDLAEEMRFASLDLFGL